MLAKITAKNQLSLPNSLTQAVGTAEYFDVEARDGQLILTPVRIQGGEAVRVNLAELDLTAEDMAAAVGWARAPAAAASKVNETDAADDLNASMFKNQVDSEAGLNELLGTTSAGAWRKEVDHIHPIYRQWIESSPFAVVATAGPQGLDASTRGDPAPLVRVLDPRTLLLPERKGNNRADGLRNLLIDPRISLMFFVPQVQETLRVNGRATIWSDPDLLASFAINGQPPVCVVRIDVESVYFQCAKAIMRSKLWTTQQRPDAVPTPGQMLAALTDNELGGVAYDQALPERLRSGLY